MFPKVCKHYLIIYGCLKFTLKKEKRIEKKLKKKHIDKISILLKKSEIKNIKPESFKRYG